MGLRTQILCVFSMGTFLGCVMHGHVNYTWKIRYINLPRASLMKSIHMYGYLQTKHFLNISIDRTESCCNKLKHCFGFGQCLSSLPPPPSPPPPIIPLPLHFLLQLSKLWGIFNEWVLLDIHSCYSPLWRIKEHLPVCNNSSYFINAFFSSENLLHRVIEDFSSKQKYFIQMS